MMEQVEDKEDVYLLKASDYSYAAVCINIPFYKINFRENA